MAVSRAFVSHSHNDSRWCDEFVDTLKQNGVDIWYNKQGINRGPEQVKVVENELQSRDTFIIILTPDSWSERWVQRELDFAIAQHKQIIGIMLKSVQLRGFITNYQIIDSTHQDAQTSASIVLFQAFNIMTPSIFEQRRQAQMEQEKQTQLIEQQWQAQSLIQQQQWQAQTLLKQKSQRAIEDIATRGLFGCLGSFIGFWLVGFYMYGIGVSVGGIIGGSMGSLNGGRIGGGIGFFLGILIGGFWGANKTINRIAISCMIGGIIGIFIGIAIGITVGTMSGAKLGLNRETYIIEAIGLIVGTLIGAFSGSKGRDPQTLGKSR